MKTWIDLEGVLSKINSFNHGASNSEKSAPRNYRHPAQL